MLVLNKTLYSITFLLVWSCCTPPLFFFWITPLTPDGDKRKLCLLVIKRGVKCDMHPHTKLEASLICVWSRKRPTATPKLDSGRCYRGKKCSSKHPTQADFILPGYFTDAIHANIDRSSLRRSLLSQFCSCQHDTKANRTAFPADSWT